jgi:protease IV
MMNRSAVVLEAIANLSRWWHNRVARLAAGPDYVVMELSGELPERRPRPQGVRGWLQRRFRPTQQSLEEWRERLKILALDPRVAGVILTLGDVRAGLPALESLRRNLEEFRASGKRLIAYIVTTNLRTYYLVSAAEMVVAPESAELALHGLRLEATFLRTALDQLGILPQFHHIAEYKSATNRFLYPAMPEPQRQMLNSLLDGAFAEVVGAIARTRQLPEEEVRSAIDRGLLSAAEARERRLVDAVAFADQLPTILSRTSQPATIHTWERARQRLHLPYRWRSVERQAVAIVPLLGTIVPGESRHLPLPLPLVGQQLAGHESIAQALRRAEQISSIKAIVLYVDSPGGSAIASDLIWREVSRVQERKPVVVCMGSVAASGGYYVACGARHIVAGATTLTGSIGVIAGKMNLQGLLDKVGVHREIVMRGATAAMPSAFISYSEPEWDMLQRWMEEIYQRFKARVAAGRGLTLEAVEAVARGRVWNGRQALDHGLIDALGDFEAAVRQAKNLAGIPLDADVPLLTPRPGKNAPWPSVAPAAWDQGWRSVTRLLGESALVLMPSPMVL